MQTKNLDFKKYVNKNKTTSQSVESYLIDLEKATDDQVKFWSEYYEFFANEREKYIEEIQDALLVAQKLDGDFKGFARIVSTNFGQDPLCSIGSIRKKSNRFNFGKIKPSLTSFQALYVGEDHPTAYLECYGRELGTKYGKGEYGAEVFSVQPDPHVFCRVDVHLDRYIDLTDIDTLAPFVDVLKEIKIPSHLESKAKKLLGTGVLDIVTTVTKLKKSLLYRDHAQWPTLLDQPSNPQWFGFYVWTAGISGILYPSVRHKFGRNIAIFPDNIENSSSKVELVGDYPFVEADRKCVDSSNWQFMMHPAARTSKN